MFPLTTTTTMMHANRSLMERCISAGVPAPMLSIQYRMHPTICKPVSSLFYNHRLRSPQGLDITRSKSGFARIIGGAAVWVNTTGSETALPKAGYRNDDEVDTVMKIHLSVVGEGRTVFVITFYNAQKYAIESRMADYNGSRLDGVSVLSVDSVQVSIQ